MGEFDWSSRRELYNENQILREKVFDLNSMIAELNEENGNQEEGIVKLEGVLKKHGIKISD